MKIKNGFSRLLVTLAASAVVVSVAGGCISVVPYEPNVGLVAAKGAPEVNRICAEVMNRAVNPHVTAVDVTDEYLRYAWIQTQMGPFYTEINTPAENRIYYVNLARVEIYQNFNVYVWGPQDSRVDKVMFSNMEDAKLFADCLMSLKSAHKKS